MSTTVTSIYGKKVTLTDGWNGKGSNILFDLKEPTTSRIIDRADFLAAVAKECGVVIVPADAVVIERGELPEVTLGNGGAWNVGTHSLRTDWTTDTPTKVRAAAVRWLALAEHLDTHPPIDEAQVSALTDALEAAGVMVNPAERARRLYLAGVRIKNKAQS